MSFNLYLVEQQFAAESKQTSESAQGAKLRSIPASAERCKPNFEPASRQVTKLRVVTEVGGRTRSARLKRASVGESSKYKSG